jgi:hypothetical protein
VAPSGDTWERLAAAFPETGLWPVLVAAGELQPDFWRGPDWEAGAARDPERVLRRLWKEGLPLGEGERRGYANEVLTPFGAPERVARDGDRRQVVRDPQVLGGVVRADFLQRQVGHPCVRRQEAGRVRDHDLVEPRHHLRVGHAARGLVARVERAQERRPRNLLAARRATEPRDRRERIRRAVVGRREPDEVVERRRRRPAS